MQNSAQNVAKFGRKVRSKIVAKFGREKFGWEKLLQNSNAINICYELSEQYASAGKNCCKVRPKNCCKERPRKVRPRKVRPRKVRPSKVRPEMLLCMIGKKTGKFEPVIR